MEKIIEVTNLSFTYPENEAKALSSVSFSVNKGDYIAVLGESGCGKTTLLRSLKPSIAPVGLISGQILLSGKSINELTLKEQSEKIGFVFQNPDTQCVTDTVWHELSFGLENSGLSSDVIRSKVAETASYFGIEQLMNRETAFLSGGEKQLVNLAAVSAMRPEILILDEPVSQLDPINAKNFLNTVKRINRDFGTTVIITEHQTDEIFAEADKLLIMENGKCISFDSPVNTAKRLKNEFSHMSYLMPVPLKIAAQPDFPEAFYPLTIKDGKKWLSSTVNEPVIREIERAYTKDETAVSVRCVSFGYSKKDKELIDDLSCTFKKNKINIIAGGNGAGKSTLLKLIAGIRKTLNGKIKHSFKRLAYMPQQPENLFLHDTVKADLLSVSKDIEKAAALTGISHLLLKNPLDLSGGELQKAAIAKLLLLNPDLLLLDEPTKSLDAKFKESLGLLLKQLSENGCTVIIASHDIEFCAEYGDYMMLLFDGKIVSEKSTPEFLRENMFYTTAARKMSSHIFENAVTAEEVIMLCKKNLKL